MKGDSFRREKIVTAHENCDMCATVAKLALNNFREARSEKTTSYSGDHWAEVTK